MTGGGFIGPGVDPQEVTVKTGDVQIGAVEIKDKTDADRADVHAANTARTTSTPVLAIQAIDATGKVPPAGDLKTNPQYMRLSDGTDNIDQIENQVSEITLADLTNIASGDHQYPTGGKDIKPYKHLSLTGVLIADVGETLTLTVHASNEGIGGRFHDVTKSGTRTDTGLNLNVSITVTNGTETYAIHFDNFNYKTYYVNVNSTQAVPNNTLEIDERLTAI